jgi:hypothetical protein
LVGVRFGNWLKKGFKSGEFESVDRFSYRREFRRLVGIRFGNWLKKGFKNKKNVK